MYVFKGWGQLKSEAKRWIHLSYTLFSFITQTSNRNFGCGLTPWFFSLSFHASKEFYDPFHNKNLPVLHYSAPHDNSCRCGIAQKYQRDIPAPQGCNSFPATGCSSWIDDSVQFCPVSSDGTALDAKAVTA